MDAVIATICGLTILFFESFLALKMRKTTGKTIKDGLIGKWVFVLMGVLGGIAWTYCEPLNFPVSTAFYLVVGILMLAGLYVRLWAIFTLGKFFSVNLAVDTRQTVINTGPYYYVIHPSYTGTLLTMFAFGLSMHNWMSLISVFVPAFLMIEWRASVEEGFLNYNLGPSYEDYCDTRKRYIPYIY